MQARNGLARVPVPDQHFYHGINVRNLVRNPGNGIGRALINILNTIDLKRPGVQRTELFPAKVTKVDVLFDDGEPVGVDKDMGVDVATDFGGKIDVIPKRKVVWVEGDVEIGRGDEGVVGAGDEGCGQKGPFGGAGLGN